jgi:hypothetical protein
MRETKAVATANMLGTDKEEAVEELQLPLSLVPSS